MDNFLDNNIINKIDTGLSKIQESFLQTNFGQVIDNSINAGLRAVLPDCIENQLIDIKNSLFENGLKETVDSVIASVLETGKSVSGIFTGDFDNISQIEQAIKKGGLIDIFDSLIDKGLEYAEKNNFIDKTNAKAIKSGKDIILKNLEKNIDETINNQIKAIEKLDNYCNEWQKAFENKDLNNMNKAFKNIEKQLTKIVPLETILEKAKSIENLQNLIKNNGGNFDLSAQEFELSKLLI